MQQVAGSRKCFCREVQQANFRSSYQEANDCRSAAGAPFNPEWCSGVHKACRFGGRGGVLRRKPGPCDHPNPAGPMCSPRKPVCNLVAMPAKLTACRSGPQMSDIRTVEPISPEQLIVSQSQPLPSPCPVMGAKPPRILARVLALAPTHRPERLQET